MVRNSDSTVICQGNRTIKNKTNQRLNWLHNKIQWLNNKILNSVG
uniref:Uncharacterized protein n=1 Tax=Arundo donax TaxID=35708 RepID=A0A0A9DHW2_ARUDO